MTISFFKFITQVKHELKKITWPTKQETIVTSIMVFILAFIAAVFFLLVDGGLSSIVNMILG